MEYKLPFELVEKEVLVRQEAETSKEYGTEPDERPIKDLLKCGVVNIDKQRGPTSHQISDYLQKILGLSKAGHSGTLDPAVTGVENSLPEKSPGNPPGSIRSHRKTRI